MLSDVENIEIRLARKKKILLFLFMLKILRATRSLPLSVLLELNRVLIDDVTKSMQIKCIITLNF